MLTNQFRQRISKSASLIKRAYSTNLQNESNPEPPKKPNPIIERLTRDRPLLDYDIYMFHARGFQRFDFWRHHPLLNVNPIRYPKEWQYFLPGWKVGSAIILFILILETLGLKEKVLKDPVEEYHNEVTLNRLPEEFREEAKHLMHH